MRNGGGKIKFIMSGDKKCDKQDIFFEEVVRWNFIFSNMYKGNILNILLFLCFVNVVLINHSRNIS